MSEKPPLSAKSFPTSSPKDGRGSMSSFRVLVVEDHEPFRRFVCSTLGKRTKFQVVCEASDGLEAVNKAQELQPGLILLDIGLPSLNGIEAARQIRRLCPESKIVFVTQESAAELVQEARALGALGYVLKACAGSELLDAVEAVSQGERFVSPRLCETDQTDAQTPDCPSDCELVH